MHFYTGSKASLLNCIREGVKQPYSFVVTPNVDHLAQLQDNPALREAYAKARLRLCDSRILQPLLQRLGVQIEEVIPGSDLTMDLLDWANREHLRIVLIGATEQECSKSTARRWTFPSCASAASAWWSPVRSILPAKYRSPPPR
ncbi:N-acetyl-mannosamine transferase [Stutzerimonas stutzeri B1SMN1]|nr:N-acetyl-mannosamine transferase [Stutzerimonas stutzeri B1SMN1]